jgi:hypothetical protein
VTNFAQSNLYISNAELDTIYQINLDQLSFIDGYTGKFSNIGKGNMIINTKDTMKFVGTCTTATSITLAPQESVELVCYNNEDKKELLVIGKSL